MKKYQQCRLSKGEFTATAWIEQRGAKIGAIVELLPSRDEWTVTKVYDHVMSEDSLREVQMLNRRSLPSVEGMG